MSYGPTEKHWHELLWRIALAIHEQGSDQLKYGKGRAIWPHPMTPLAFERGPNGDWNQIDTKQVQKDLIEEDVAMSKLSKDLLYLPGLWKGGIALNQTDFKPIPNLVAEGKDT